MYYLCTSEEERTLNTGFFPLFLPDIKHVKQSMKEILHALADFLYALAEIFLALSVRGLTIQVFEKLKDIYFQPCIFFIFGNYSGRFLPKKNSLAGS